MSSKGSDFGEDRERYGMSHLESVPFRPKVLDVIADAVLAYKPPEKAKATKRRQKRKAKRDAKKG
jgi:hypothetical protein